jgi:type VI protein secretion system component Hcp
MAKKSKAQVRKRKASKDLAPRDARAVKGGDGTVTARKAGKGQQEFLIVKMQDVIVTSVQPGG